MSQPRTWQSVFQADGAAVEDSYGGALEEWREPGVLPLVVRACPGKT